MIGIDLMDMKCKKLKRWLKNMYLLGIEYMKNIQLLEKSRYLIDMKCKKLNQMTVGIDLMDIKCKKLKRWLKKNYQVDMIYNYKNMYQMT